MCSHSIKPEKWLFVGSFLWNYLLCLWTVKALARLDRCASSWELLLFAYVDRYSNVKTKQFLILSFVLSKPVHYESQTRCIYPYYPTKRVRCWYTPYGPALTCAIWILILSETYLYYIYNWFILRGKMSRLMTKPTKWLCTQRRLRSAWASAQTDQSLRCALDG